MALNLTGLWRKFESKDDELIYQSENHAQNIIIDSGAVTYLCSKKQLTRFATEAGGQLFGSINDTTVSVLKATGPYRNDERTRTRYRSDPGSAQKEIQKQLQNGLIYLGEWHTHAEPHPTPSQLDYDVMSELIKRSDLNSNELLMIIIGSGNLPSCLSLTSLDGKRIANWNILQRFD